MANDDAWQAGIDIASKHGDTKRAKKSAGKSAQTVGAGAAQSGGGGKKNPWSILSYIPLKHSGGKVRKTGPYRLKKGERVLTATQQKSLGLKKKRAKKSQNKRTITKA